MRFGCQTYTWQMSLATYRGRIADILEVVSGAGFVGLEAEVCMLGAYERDPGRLAEELARHKVDLAALCLVLDWRNPEETPEEFEQAEQVMTYLQHFPGAILCLCQMPGKDRHSLRERQRNAIACVSAVARRAMERGISSAFHPNSPSGSVFRTEEDYQVLCDGLDAAAVGFAPDAGHMAKGRMDVTALFEKYRSLIRHVHFKDISLAGQWVEMGRGCIDFPAIVARLRETGYEGWIMVEDESARGESDPDTVSLENGQYVRTKLMPAASGI